MPGKGCRKRGRAHTPITSRVEHGAMGVVYAKKKGKKVKLKGPARKIAKSMSKAELKRHLEESKGKKLPKKAKRGRK